MGIGKHKTPAALLTPVSVSTPTGLDISYQYKARIFIDLKNIAANDTDESGARLANNEIVFITRDYYGFRVGDRIKILTLVYEVKDIKRGQFKNPLDVEIKAVALGYEFLTKAGPVENVQL